MNSSGRRGRLTAGLTVLLLALSTVTPTIAGAATAAITGSVPTTAAPVKVLPGRTTHPATGKKTARSLCDTEVPRGTARCFAMVLQTNGIVPMVAGPTGLSPADVLSAYQLPQNGGAGMVIGIVDAFDDPAAAADLAVYRSTFGLPALAAGQFVKVSQRGGTDLPVPDAGWAGEISLDLDAVTAVAPNAKIVLVEADSPSFTDLGAAVNQAVAQGAKFVSNSYGTGYTSAPGSGEDSSLLPIEQQYYNHPGVAIVASSGDNDYGVSFPASSQYVTGVGGTTLTKDASPRGWTESVWSNAYGGPGSGCSSVFPKPVFQTDTGCATRTVADVSAVADPATGLSVYNTFQAPGWAVYGGTSLSSPLIAATYALAGSPAPRSYPNSYPYQHPGALNDVTSGSNGSCSPAYLCSAEAGFDGPTGLGTPKGLVAFAAGPRGEVRGLVTDKATAQPIAGAKVTVGTGTAAVAGITDAHGAYDVSIAPGNYSVSVSAYGYLSSTGVKVTVVNGGTASIPIALTKAKTHSITGRVTDGSGHGYALYAQILFAGVPGGPVYSDPYSGQFSVDLPGGTTYQMTVIAQYPGYLTSTTPVKISSTDLVDNIVLKADPLSEGTPGYHLRKTGVVQGFDGATAPTGWTVTDKKDPGWSFTDPAGRGNLTGGTGGFAIVDSDYAGPTKSQDSYLTSPAVNLAGATGPTLEFDTFFLGSGSGDDGVVELSTNNGSTWVPIWDAGGVSATGHVKIGLPTGASKAGVKVRFHYTGSWGLIWEVDNVFLGNRSQVLQRGGLVAGIVTDANTRARVQGAAVTNSATPPDLGITASTGDPVVGDGFYWLFSTRTATQGLAAAKTAYGTATATAYVVTNGVIRQDFALKAGRIGISTTSISKKLTWGGAATSTVTLTNSGGLSAKVTLGEQSGGFVLQSATGAPLHIVKARTFKGSAKTAAARAGLLAGQPKVAAGPSADAWQPGGNYPTPIQDSGAVSANGVLYSVGGFDGSGDTSALYSYDPKGGTWTERAAAADTREAPATGYVGGRIVVAGGWGGDGTPDANTEIYTPGSNTWSTGAPMPTPYAGSGRAMIGAKLYVIGGCLAASCGTTDVQVYDASANRWSTVAPYPEAVSWESCGGIDGKIYCAGGTTDSASTAKSYVYNTSTDKWSATTDLPVDMWGSFAAAANGKLLVAGGIIQNGAAITNQGYSFDPTTAKWTALPNLNVSLFRGSGALGFYGVGGSNGNGPTTAVQVLAGYDQGGDTNVPWLSETPTTLTIAPGRTATFTVKVNAADRSIVQPGTYTAVVSASSDTPYYVSAVHVSMAVTPPATWGKLMGTVTTKNAGGQVVPLSGVTVEIDSRYSSHTLTTGLDGRYSLWLDQKNAPVTIIVAKDGYRPQTATSTVLAGKTVVRNWRLIKA